MANINLIDIVAPQLEESSYGKGIQTQFDNINRNFKILGNADFVKGDRGKGVVVRKVLLVQPADDYTPSENIIDNWLDGEWLYTQIVAAIETAGIPTTSEAYERCFENMPGTPAMVVFQEGDDGELEKPLGIEPYIFIDGRLSYPEYFGSELETCADLSTVIYTEDVEEHPFERVNTFPTIYYNAELNGFYWRILGNDTNLPAQGPKGKDGFNGVLPVVKVGSDRIEGGADNGWYVITHVLTPTNGSFQSVTDAEASQILGHITEDNPTAALVLKPNGNVHVYDYYISYIHIHSTDYCVKAENDNQLDLALNDAAVAKWLCLMHPQTSLSGSAYGEYNKGLFVPMIKHASGWEEDTIQAHTLFAGSNNTLVVAPVSDVKTMNSENPSLENGFVDVRYNNVMFTGQTGTPPAKFTSARVDITGASVTKVFEELYNKESGTGAGGKVGAEKRFEYVWRTARTDGQAWPESQPEDTRLASYDSAQHPPVAYICADGFLWYRDPYSYLRLTVGTGGAVSIVVPTNSSITGAYTFNNGNTVNISAEQTSTNAQLSTDAYWKITDN